MNAHLRRKTSQDVLDSVAGRIENAGALDRIAEALAAAVRTVIRPGPTEDLLTGTPLGHPLHPALVAVPIGAWASVPVLDLLGEDTAARRLTGFGCVAAVPTAASGAADWLTTAGAERRVGLVHAIANYTALTLQALSWQARRQRRRGLGIALSLAGTGVLGVAGWLGGHLAYAQGVGVDTTVFQKLPTDWTDVCAEADVPTDGAPLGTQAHGIPILLARTTSGIAALAGRCTHRGGPLHEGEVYDGCVTCPWHGSVFSLEDGSVRSGPATRPEPSFEIRTRDGRIEIRRNEERTLRTNPTGI